MWTCGHVDVDIQTFRHMDIIEKDNSHRRPNGHGRLSMAMSMDMAMDIWTYGYVDMGTWGHADMWTCGHMDMWTCGHMDIWTYGHNREGQ